MTTAEPTPPPPSNPWLEELPPRQIVAELDRYIIGQDAAKKAIAIAIRNRWRRAQAPDPLREEITPSQHHPDRADWRRQDRGGPATCAACRARRSSRSRPPSSPRWGTSVAMPSRWSATWWTRRSRSCGPNGRTRSTTRRRGGPMRSCSTSSSLHRRQLRQRPNSHRRSSWSPPAARLPRPLRRQSSARGPAKSCAPCSPMVRWTTARSKSR